MCKISVCLAAYNGERFIKKQILSNLMQLSDKDELIISDDGSTDNTINIIHSINDHRIKCIYHNKSEVRNSKNSLYYIVASNFENALSCASGDIIFLSDQDDIWAPNKVEIYLKALERADLVQGNYTYIDINDNEILGKRFCSSPFKNMVYDLFVLPFHGASMAFKRNILNLALPFPANLIQHDSYLGKIALLRGKCTFISLPLTFYRVHEHNVSQPGSKSPNSLIFKIYFRVRLLYQAIYASFIKHK